MRRARKRSARGPSQWLGTTAALALVCALVLPAASSQARVCGTMATEAFHRQHVSPLFAAAERPFEPGLFLDSTLFDLRVHYLNVETETRAQETLAVLEAAYQSQVLEQGFAAPLPDEGRGGSDALDLYLTFIGTAGGRTLRDDDADSTDGRHAASAHMQIDPNVFELDTFVVHEFNHVLQFSTDSSETLMFFESSAVYQEIRAYPDATGWRANVTDHQMRPEAGPHVDGIQWGQLANDPSLLEYGAGLFIAYLDEVHGEGDGTFIADLWNASIQPDEVAENEPDWGDAVADLTGLSLNEILLDYSTWRAFVGPRAEPGIGPSFGAELRGDQLMRTQTQGGELDGQAVRTLPKFTELGCLPIEVTAPALTPLQLWIHAEDTSETPRALGLGIAMLGFDATRSSMAADGPVLDVVIEVPSSRRMIFAVCDNGDIDVDDEPTNRTVSYSVRDLNGYPIVDAGPGSADAGPGEPEPSPEPEPTCSCQSTGLPDGGPFGRAKKWLFPLMLLGGFVSLVIRSRRARRNKKSYSGSRPQTRNPDV